MGCSGGLECGSERAGCGEFGVVVWWGVVGWRRDQYVGLTCMHFFCFKYNVTIPLRIILVDL